MNQLRIFTRIVFLSLFIFSPLLASDVTPKTLPEEINKILSNPALKGTQIGIKIISLKNNDVLFEKNPNSLLIPASNAKILTAAAALKQIGPSFRFTTKALTDGKIEGNKLNGNLYLKGDGDTFFVTEMIYYFANELAREGFTEINGNLVIDDFYFDRDYGVPAGDEGRAFVAPVSAVAANFNSVAVFVQPGDTVGSPAKVIIDPPNEFIIVKNNTKTGKGGSKSTISVVRKSSAGSEGNSNTIQVEGSIPLGGKEDRFYRGISSPPMYAGAVVKSIFSQRGIKLVGNLEHKETPSTAKELLVYKSKTFDLVIKDLMNFSNNMIANQLIKVLGANKYGAPGSMEKGLKAEQEVLSSLGISPRNYTMVDGSGYDRQDKVSAEVLTTILKKMSEDLVLFPAFWFSFPVAGEEGTLERRFYKNGAKGKIRAKSGTITGVATLSGYAPTKDGELLAFSILINDPKGRTRELYIFQEKIGELLCGFTRQQ